MSGYLIYSYCSPALQKRRKISLTSSLSGSYLSNRQINLKDSIQTSFSDTQLRLFTCLWRGTSFTTRHGYESYQGQRSLSGRVWNYQGRSCPNLRRSYLNCKKLLAVNSDKRKIQRENLILKENRHGS